MKYDAIAIDTSIYQRHGFKFDQGLLKTLEQFKGKPAGLLIPEIVAREIIDHIAQKANEAAIQLERAHKNYDEEFGSLKENNFHASQHQSGEEVAKRKFASFVKNTGAKIIKTEGLLNVQKLIDCYFNKTPPFPATGKKKSEFPDAITLLVLDEYAKRNDIRILSVSADTDWKEYISTSERMSHTDDLAKGISEFQTQESLFEACKQLSDFFKDPQSIYLSELRTEISKKITQQRFKYEAYSEFIWEEQLLALDFVDFEFFSGNEEATFYPVSIKHDKITVETKIIIKAKAIGEFSLFLHERPNWSSDPNTQVGGSRKEQHLKIIASLIFTTDNAELELFGPTLKKLDISFDPIYVNFGSLELTQQS
ncbi:PIN_12 domain-containing protein [Ectopseudomonas oleovorans]|uniref:Uncharacterized protein n=1 Tax=Ectopseudomonas oleovorans TaxID=301 RepID=A0A653B8M1_ECTOL|nr:PIN_12 domain-containing protein [Pseudomonas oleovorans]